MKPRAEDNGEMKQQSDHYGVTLPYTYLRNKLSFVK